LIPQDDPATRVPGARVLRTYDRDGNGTESQHTILDLSVAPTQKRARQKPVIPENGQPAVETTRNKRRATSETMCFEQGVRNLWFSPYPTHHTLLRTPADWFFCTATMFIVEKSMSCDS
jgi:hypothetical protein